MLTTNYLLQKKLTSAKIILAQKVSIFKWYWCKAYFKMTFTNKCDT